jgi:hypothetical protein
MSRAQGKHPQRGVIERLIDEFGGGGEDKPLTEGEAAQLGIGEPREIPGGLKHLGNPPVVHGPVPVPASEYPFSNAILAHGVEPEGHMHERDPRLTGGQSGRVEYDEPAKVLQTPVLVEVVEKPWRHRPQAVCDTRRVTAPAAGSEPAMICGANPARSLVQLLNEDTSHQVRFGQLRDLLYDAENTVITGGARLPAGASSYTVFRSQDELYVTSETSSTAVISVILESEVAQ